MRNEREVIDVMELLSASLEPKRATIEVTPDDALLLVSLASLAEFAGPGARAAHLVERAKDLAKRMRAALPKQSPPVEAS